MLSSNPELVQKESCPGKDDNIPTPVFLIHDSSGTTTAYHALRPLNRLIYAIRNPHFPGDGRFEGGLPEMAQVYSNLIRSTVTMPEFPKSGSCGKIKIHLGGWSLGGLLCLEIARLLAEDQEIEVAGILMIDCIYPGDLRQFRNILSGVMVSETGMPKAQYMKQRCVLEAIRMLMDWEVPVWDGHVQGQRPKILLLKAMSPSPVGMPASLFDIYRQDRMLGWKAYDGEMFDDILGVAGHHVELFDSNRVFGTSEAIRQGLGQLDL